MSDKSEYCPTQNGTFTGYRAEFRIKRGDFVKGDWKEISTKDAFYPKGFPYPSFCGGILQTIHLQGYHQALAIGHGYAAFAEAKGITDIEIRVVGYDIKYDIKAKKIETK